MTNLIMSITLLKAMKPLFDIEMRILAVYFFSSGFLSFYSISHSEVSQSRTSATLTRYLSINHFSILPPLISPSLAETKKGLIDDFESDDDLLLYEQSASSLEDHLISVDFVNSLFRREVRLITQPWSHQAKALKLELN